MRTATEEAVSGTEVCWGSDNWGEIWRMTGVAPGTDQGRVLQRVDPICFCTAVAKNRVLAPSYLAETLLTDSLEWLEFPTPPTHKPSPAPPQGLPGSHTKLSSEHPSSMFSYLHLPHRPCRWPLNLGSLHTHMTRDLGNCKDIQWEKDMWWFCP